MTYNAGAYHTRARLDSPVVSVHMEAYATGIPDLLPHNKIEFILIVIVQATDDLMSQKSELFLPQSLEHNLGHT